MVPTIYPPPGSPGSPLGPGGPGKPITPPESPYRHKDRQYSDTEWKMQNVRQALSSQQWKGSAVLYTGM